VQWKGNYYYSEANQDIITIRKSPTLLGLNRAAVQTVWTPWAVSGTNLTNVWSPEIHFLNGRWYLYFIRRTPRRSPSSAICSRRWRRSMGQIHGRKYRTAERIAAGFYRTLGNRSQCILRGRSQPLSDWSCTGNSVGDAPQFICLARMSDPLHISSQTVRISKPTRRGKPARPPFRKVQ